MTNGKVTSEPWRAIAESWNIEFAPPSRVSQDETKKYKEWLLTTKKPNMKVLLLGVTPEIRDVLAELEIETICLDINSQMVLAMNSILQKNNPKETVKIGDWLKNSLESKSFDVIIGDCVLENVEWKRRDEFLEEIKRLLKPSGVFLTRIFVSPREPRFASLKDLLDDFTNREPTHKTALELACEALFLDCDPVSHACGFKKFKKSLEKIRGKDGFNLENENLNRILDMYWESFCIKFVNKIYYFPYKDEEEERFKNTFEIIKVFEAPDNRYSKLTPLYFLKLK